MGASAAGAIVAANIALDNLPWLKDQKGWIPPAALVALGAAGGIGIGRYWNRSVGTGVGVGLVGLGLYRLALHFIGSGKVPGLRGLGAEEDLLLGTGISEIAQRVRDASDIPGAVEGLGAEGHGVQINEAQNWPPTGVGGVGVSEVASWLGG